MVDMLRLGKLIPNTTTSVEMFNFDMSVMARTGRPTAVEFCIESQPFGTGGFRKAFKATSNDREFQGSTWVVKRYLEKALEDIIAIGQTLEEGRENALPTVSDKNRWDTLTKRYC